MKRAFLLLSLAASAAMQTACVSEPVKESNRGAQGTTSDVARVNTQLGLAYLVEGQLDLALDRLQTAAQADPGYSAAQNGLGLVYDRLGMSETAERHFKRAISINPSDSASQTNYGAFLCRHGRVDEGEKLFMKAATNPLYNKPELAYVNAGLCKRKEGDLKTAEHYFRAALRIDPRLAVALLNMAEISHELKRHLSARAYLQRYDEVGTQTSRSLWLGVLVERELGDKDAVSSYAMLLKANYPDSKETQLLLESGVQ